MTDDSCKDFFSWAVTENVSDVPSQSSVQFIGRAKDPCECICTKPWLLGLWRSARLAAKKAKAQSDNLRPGAPGYVPAVDRVGYDRARMERYKAECEAETERQKSHQTPTAASGKVAEANKPEHRIDSEWIENAKRLRAERAAEKARQQAEEAEEDEAKKAEQQRQSAVTAAPMNGTKAATVAQEAAEKKADAAIWGDDDFWADLPTGAMN
jgi:hypothetical protein